MELINVDCYNCGSTKSEFYDEENGFELVKCTSCGLLYIKSRPTEKAISEAALYGMHEGEKTLSTTGMYSFLRIRRYLRILKDLYPNNILKQKDATWFDIGCGFGEFLESLLKYSNNNLTVKGSEPNKYKVISAQKRNLDVSAIDLARVEEKFDYVSLLNVYSHLPDPIAFLSDLSHLLKDNGELLLETGHSCHLPAKLHHKPYFLPDHLSFANKEIIEGILKRAGFSIVETRIYRHPQFPRYTDFPEVAKEILKIILRKNGKISNFFPKQPDRDMYIRCVKSPN